MAIESDIWGKTWQLSFKNDWVKSEVVRKVYIWCDCRWTECEILAILTGIIKTKEMPSIKGTCRVT